jgi:ATP-dependent Clp protease ATP-binding subunit ClpA
MQRVAELGYQLNLDKAKHHDKGFDKQFGARPLKELFKNMLKMLAEKLPLKLVLEYLWILKMELKLTVKVLKLELNL